MSWIEDVAFKFGKTLASFQRGVAGTRKRPGFLSGWAESSKWSGGDSTSRGAQRRAMQNSWVYAAVQLIAREVSAAELGVIEQSDAESDPVAVRNHPVERVLRRPNPYIGRSFLWQYTAMWLELSGDAYWFTLVDAGGEVVEIWPLPSRDVEVMPGDGERFVDYFRYTVNGREYHIPAENVIHFMLPNPFDIFRGLSPLVAAMLPSDSDTAMAVWNGAFFGRDNVMPSAIINIKSDESGDLEGARADIEMLKQDLRAEYGAIGRRTLVTAGDAISAVLLGWNPKDMDFLAGRQFTKDEIFVIYGIPGGMMDKNATEANATVAEKNFKDKTIWPLLCLLAEQLTAQWIVPRYGRSQEAAFKDIRVTNRAIELQEVAQAGPYLTVDEVRQRYWQLPALPDGAGKLPAGRQPAAGIGGIFGVQPTTQAGQVTGYPALQAAALSDIRLWREKSVRRWSRSGDAAAPFVSDHIPAAVRAKIEAALGSANSLEAVKAIFDGVLSGDDPHAAEKAEEQLELQAALEDYLSGLLDRVTEGVNAAAG